MTTTAQRRTPTQAKPPAYSEFKHTPLTAAASTFFCVLFFTTIGKFLGIAPWIPLVGGLVMAATFGIVGKHRQPRPLSRVSRIFRGTAAALAGGWSWWHLATFPEPAMSTTQMTVMLAAWPATIAAVWLAIVFRRVPALFRLAVPGGFTLFTLVLTATMYRPVLAWVSAVLTDTDALPIGPGHYGETFPWLGYAALSLVMIVAPMTVIGIHFANQERTAEEELAELEQQNAPAHLQPEARRIERLVNQLTSEFTELRSPDGTKFKRPNLRITDVTLWDNGAGDTYIFDLSGGERGTTRDSLRMICDNLATKLNLPDGCGVEILYEKGMSRGTAAVAVSRKDLLGDAIPYPEVKMRSILNGLEIGRGRAGKPISLLLREDSVFCWGQKGSGKTVTLFDIIAGAIQCTDTLVWVIDLNGGSVAAPFLKAWYDGRVDRPCIDWVATTTEEVVDMAEVAINIAKDRKLFYRDLKGEQNTNLMPIGNGGPGAPPPQILIVMDEGKEILGTKNLDENQKEAQASLLTIMDLARDAAVNVVVSGLRATSDVLDPAFLAGASVRIGMRVKERRELAYGFDNDYGLNPAETPHKGSGFISTGFEDPIIQVFKAFYLDPHRMAEIGEITTPWRPYLDERGLQIAGRVYADRWRRTARYIFKEPREEILEYGAGPVTAQQREAATEAATETTAAGTTTAVLDRPAADQGDRPAGIDWSAATRPPSVGGWAGITEAADFVRGRERENRRRKDMGLDPLDEQPPTAPAGGPPAGGQPPAPVWQPPATGGGDPTPQPEPELDDADQAELDEKTRIDQMFAEIAKNEPELAQGPRDWPMAPISADAELSGAPAASRQILERLVKARGPLGWKDMLAKLNAGGDWGPPVPISGQAMGKLLKKPGTEEPVEWLLPRKHRDPYTHRDTLK